MRREAVVEASAIGEEEEARRCRLSGKEDGVD